MSNCVELQNFNFPDELLVPKHMPMENEHFEETSHFDEALYLDEGSHLVMYSILLNTIYTRL